VTACIALASTGGVEGSFFTVQRCSPWLSRHSHGDSNVTGGDVAAAALQRKAIAAIVNVARAIAPDYITSSLRCGEQKSTIRRVNYWNTIADTLDSLNKARLWN
jgi:hypothetical protein